MVWRLWLLIIRHRAGIGPGGLWLSAKKLLSALITDMDLPATELWRLYRGRADCENRIKELKYDFGADSFNIKNFWATEAALLTVMLAYNLMSLFRQGILKNDSVSAKSDVQHTLETLRYRLSAKAGYITKDSRKKIINLAGR